MTSTAIISRASNLFMDTTAERIVLPSMLQTADCLAAWSFYTLKDSTGNGRDLVLGPSALLDDDGALKIGTGSNAYASCTGLTLPSSFCLIISVFLGSNTGAIFGNFVSTTVGFRLYSTSTALMAKIGDDSGRSVLTLTPLGWFDIGVSLSGTTLTLCTETASVTSTEASSLGSGICRFGSQESSGVTSASGAIIPAAALYSTARSVADMRTLMAIARAKREADGYL